MSIILDALKRASSIDVEKTDHDTSLGRPFVRKKVKGGRKFYILVFSLLGFVSVVVLVILVFNGFFGRDKGEEIPVSISDAVVKEGVSKPFDKTNYGKAIKSDDTRDINRVAVSMFESGHYDKAISLWQRVLEYAKKDPQVIFNIGLAYEKMGNVELAINAYNKVLGIDEDFVPALINLGNIYYRKGLFMLALDRYEKAQKLSPDDPIVHYNLGILYAQHLHRMDKAIYHFERYLSICPESSNAALVDRILSRLKGYE